VCALYRLSDRRASEKLVPTFANRVCCVVSVTNSSGRILGYLDRSHSYFFEGAPQLYSRDWVDSVPDPLFLRKYANAENRTRDVWICNQEIWPLDNRGGHVSFIVSKNLDIIHLPVFHSKQDVLETVFCLRLQVKPTQLGPIDRASPSFRSGDRIQSPKNCVLNKRQDGGYRYHLS
jgi:hypothetical protein